MPIPIIAYALGVVAVAVAGVTTAYFSSDEDEEKPKPSSNTKSKARVNHSSSNYHKREERRKKLDQFDKELIEYVKKEKIRLTNKHGVNKDCLIQKSQYRVELHSEELFKANKRVLVTRLKNEISEIDETIIKLKEWRSSHV